MKKTKSFLLLLLVFALTLPMVACTNNNPTGLDDNDAYQSDTLLTLSVWTYYSGDIKDVFYDLVDEFNRTVGKENNIIIEPRTTGSVGKLADSILASANEDIGSEPMPDIFMTYSDSAYQLDQMGMMLDMEAYFTAEELSAFRQDFLEEGRFGETETLKIIPIAKSSEIIFINKTDFDVFAGEVAVDMDLLKTWEGLAELSKQYYEWTDAKTEELNDGKAFFGMDAMANYMLIGSKQLNDPIYSVANNEVALTMSRETAKKLWDNFYVPFVKGYYATIGNFRSDDAKTGDILAYTGSTSGASWFPKQIESSKDDSYPIEAMTFPIPTFEGGTDVAVHQGAGMAVAKSDEAHQDAAILFLKWFTENKQNSLFAVQTGYIPVKEELLNIEVFHASTQAHAVEASDPLVALAASTTYAMLDSHELYASKPFCTSYEMRGVLENSLMDFAQKDLESIQVELESDTKENVLANYITDENFDTWYSQFNAELEQLIP